MKKIKNHILVLFIMVMILSIVPSFTFAYEWNEENKLAKIGVTKSLYILALRDLDKGFPVFDGQREPVFVDTNYWLEGNPETATSETFMGEITKTIEAGHVIEINNNVKRQKPSVYVELSPYTKGVDYQIIEYTEFNDYSFGVEGQSFIAKKDGEATINVISPSTYSISYNVRFFGPNGSWIKADGQPYPHIKNITSETFDLSLKEGEGFMISANHHYFWLDSEELQYNDDFMANGYGGYEGTFELTGGLLENISNSAVFPLDVGVKSGEFGFAIGQSDFRFTTITLNSITKNLTTLLKSISIHDFRGTSDGWKLTVQATPFVEVAPAGGFRPNTSPLILSNEMTIFPKSIKGRNGASLEGITLNNLKQNVIGNEVLLAQATKGNGAGAYDIAFDEKGMELSITGDVIVDKFHYPGDQATPYSSILTFNMVAGP